MLARAQHGDLPGRATLSAGRRVAAALAARAAAIAARNLTVRSQRQPDGAWVPGSQPLLRRMVDNVIDNAVGHNRRGGWIRVTTRRDGRLARLVVENGGDGPRPGQVAGAGPAVPAARRGPDRLGPRLGAGPVDRRGDRRGARRHAGPARPARGRPAGQHRAAAGGRHRGRLGPARRAGVPA